jgi:hypothetical protein
MYIQTLVPPVAGETFRFTVAGCAGTTNIEVYADSAPILKMECNDLVCKSVARIPTGTEGATLSIHAADSAGHDARLEYLISGSDPGAHSMLAR